MKNFYLLSGLIFIAINACAPKRNLVYFSDLSTKSNQASSRPTDYQPTIQENDLLKVSVNTPSSESNSLFAFNTNITGRNSNNAYERDSYRVNNKGDIILPVLGALSVKNLTIEQAQQLIAKKLDAYVKNSIVAIQFLNFRITVIGEVNHPSTFTLQDENVDLLQALGMAGDMTLYGKRNDVLIIRTVDGARTMARLDLNKASVLESPYFHLKQNDVIYVEADKSKALEYSPNNRLMPLVVATISAVAVLATTLLSR